jgi:hypothetical protein
MRSKGLIRVLLAAAMLFSVVIGVNAQGTGTAKLIVSMKAGYYASFSTSPEPGTANTGGLSNSFAEPYFETNTIRRVFIDKDGSFYFGYALVIEPIASSKQFRISVRPLGPEDEQELRARKTFQSRRLSLNYKPAALSSSSAPQIIGDGDTFALDVLINPQTGDKITDIVTVSASMKGLEEAPLSEAPRDFTIDDVEMRMVNYRLFINGELVSSGKQAGACAGPLIWFHMPEHGGRFIFSVIPHPGYDFKKIGVIENNKIKFTLNGESYEWISNTPVVGNGGNWNLYVLYDPSYVPDPFLLGVNGAAKVENRDPSAGLTSLERAVSRAKASRSSSFDKSSAPRKDETLPPTHLIIGASDRPENLLPK